MLYPGLIVFMKRKGLHVICLTQNKAYIFNSWEIISLIPSSTSCPVIDKNSKSFKP